MPVDHEAFSRDGVLVVRRLIERGLIERVRAEGDQLAAHGVGAGRKSENSWRRHVGVRSLAAHPGVLTLLSDLYGRRAFPFQTLNFQCGSEQRAHADSMHFDTLPAGLMCGVWVAIEDVGPGQGPLLYEPGSHLRPPVDRRDASDADGAFDGRRYEDLVAAGSGPMREFHAAAGDVLIWAADVVHGGAAVRDRGSTRRSQVTHYFFDDAIYFTPSRSNAEGGRLALREPLVDIATGRRVRPTFEGRPARVIRVGSRQAIVVDRDMPPPPWPVRLRSAALGAMVEARYVKESVVGRATRRAVGSVR